jgi:protein arginine kinase activator
MLCQNCKTNLAKVHFKQIINNTKHEMYLCEECANEKGHMNFGLISLDDFFSTLMGIGDHAQYQIPLQKPVICEKCGMSYEDFQKTGKLGCSNCYSLYEEKLKPLMKRLHGSTEHNGKIPERVFATMKVTKEIESLKQTLNKAIQNEEYEKAAELRDKIREIESYDTNSSIKK